MMRVAGEIALWLALFCSLLQSCLPLVGWRRGNPYLLASARPIVLAQTVTIISAFLLLIFAFVSNDFSILYVAANSHPQLPLIYRLTAVWGAHEGSVLLWIVMLNGWSCFYAMRMPIMGKTYALTIAILGWINVGFLLFLLITSDPFQAVPALYANYHLTGNDLNPLLQDPGFIIHPPMLYMGYVGFSVAFAMTLAALLTNNLQATWARLTRQFALVAWAALTLGITLGSWWSYRVLGWGGFWFWDPVENASLLPWLAGLAFIHVLMIVEKKQVAITWGVFLAIITFAMSILGTFLVRSGILISAHTFATDPKRGVFLLAILFVIVVVPLVLCHFYLPKERPITKLHLTSRTLFLIIHSGLLIIAMLTILLGTLYPLILDALHLGIISVGAPYFNSVLLPLLWLILLLMGVGPLLPWQRTRLRLLSLKLVKQLVLSVVLTFIWFWSLSADYTWQSVISVLLCLWLIIALNQYWRALPGMSLAHFGFAITIIGIVLATTLDTGEDVIMQPGDNVQVGPYDFRFIQLQETQGTNYRALTASFDVFKQTHFITTMTADKRIYTVRGEVLSKVGIHPGLFRDLYVALGEPEKNGAWSVRLYYKPFIRFIWLGGILMLFGGLSATKRKTAC